MHVFISDVHLNEPQSERYGAFLRLMDKVRNDERITDLYLVGDIFDLWVGDRKLFQEMHAEALLKIRAAALEKNIHYFEGNHDFQLGSMWKRMRVKVYQDSQTFKINKQNFLISHGDQLDQEDRSYLRLRWFFRTPVMRFLIKILPEWVVLWIASTMNTTEQKGLATVAQKKSFRINWEKWTSELRNHKIFDVFICGHHHFRADFESDDRSFRAINLGTWLDNEFKVLVYTPGASSDRFKFVNVDKV